MRIQFSFRVLFGILLQIKTIVRDFFGNLHFDRMRNQILGFVVSSLIEDIAAIVLTGTNC